MKLYHICNPQNRRAQFFREACQRVSLPDPVELPWIDLLKKDHNCHFSDATLIRLESLGEDFTVESRLIELGGGPNHLEEDFGRLRHQVAWYEGWKLILNQIAHTNQEVRFMNSCPEIALMFDKWNAQNLLADSNVPVPELLGCVENFEDLLATMEQSGARRVFLKPCHSSSASGVVAFQMADHDRMIATTSAELIPERSRIYNSLRLRQYRDPQTVRQLVDLLAEENLMVERWFPKASFRGKTFDLRVLVIAGQSRHVVMRTSSSPITNLHLGNARGSVPDFQVALGDEVWGKAITICEQAASCFPDCHYVAVDLMIGASRKSYAVAEVNAFGDLIPNINSDGDDTYTAELRAFPPTIS